MKNWVRTCPLMMNTMNLDLPPANLDELRKQETDERELSQLNVEELKERMQEKRDYVENENEQFLELKRQVALTAISSSTGKPIAPRVS